MTLLKRLHDLNLQTSYSVDLFERIEFYESLRNGVVSHYPDYMGIKQRVLSLKRYIDSQPKQFCLSHLDSVYDNFLFYPDGNTENLQLTDWEYEECRILT